MSDDGSLVVTSANETRNSLVVVPLGRGSTRPNIINTNGHVVYLELDGADDFTTFVVFTWDKLKEFTTNAEVSFAYTYMRPTGEFDMYH